MSKIKDRDQAQQVIAELLIRFGTNTAYNRIKDEASTAHQTAREIANRSAGNLLNSFVTRKPGGFVLEPELERPDFDNFHFNN